MNTTQTENYLSLVVGISNIGSNTIRTISLYNNGDSDILFGVQGTGIPFTNTWIQVKCDDASISYTTMTGANTINCGTWTGYRDVDIKITVPSDAVIDLYDVDVVSGVNTIDGYIALNKSFGIESIVKRALFGTGDL